MVAEGSLRRLFESREHVVWASQALACSGQWARQPPRHAERRTGKQRRAGVLVIRWAETLVCLHEWRVGRRRGTFPHTGPREGLAPLSRFEAVRRLVQTS